MKISRGLENMKRIIFLIVFFSFLNCIIVYAEGFNVSSGIIQHIENNIVRLNGKKYYPVVENVDTQRFVVGDHVKILYEANPKGRRYYHALVKPDEDFPPLEETPPA